MYFSKFEKEGELLNIRNPRKYTCEEYVEHPSCGLINKRADFSCGFLRLNERNNLYKFITGLFILLPLWLTGIANGASFDCSKAGTDAEKMICGDAGLSELDEELGTTYTEAIEKAPDPVALKEQQLAWLKERNSCPDVSCMKDQYQLRIEELDRIVSLVPLAESEESHYFATEAEKMKVMQDIVRRQAEFYFFGGYKEEPEFCTEFMSDFIAGRNFVAVEPDFRTDDEYDPRFERLNSCGGYCHEEGTSASDYYVVGLLGGPPYRYYHIDIDGDSENGKEDVVYAEGSDVIRRTGYTWIDTDECTGKGWVGVSLPGWGGAIPRNLYRLNTLVLYKGRAVILDVHPSSWDTYPTRYTFDAMQLVKSERKNNCNWSGWNPDWDNENTDSPKNN